MFETPEEVKQKEPKGFWIGIIVVVIIVMTGTMFYSKYKGAVPRTTTAAQSKGPADPVHDLKIQRATMNKDRSGTIENKSPAYSYGKIEYETNYVGADNSAILVNKGTLPVSIAPGEQHNSEINDALYPAGTSWYKIRIIGATPAAQ